MSKLINDIDKELFEKAKLALDRAYSPYSKYSVGAAVRTSTGDVFTGCNIENAAYGLTICAERVALFKAVSEGKRDIVELYVIINDDILPSPCGSCRQVISELAPDARITLVTVDGKHKEYSVKELLPNAFTLDKDE